MTVDPGRGPDIYHTHRYGFTFSNYSVSASGQGGDIRAIQDRARDLRAPDARVYLGKLDEGRVRIQWCDRHCSETGLNGTMGTVIN